MRRSWLTSSPRSHQSSARTTALTQTRKRSSHPRPNVGERSPRRAPACPPVSPCRAWQPRPLPISSFGRDRVRFPGGAAVVTGDQVASDALRYVGAGYIYGGPAARPGDWDCSSFVSYVLGHDLGMALPGGKWGAPGFPPGSHGPVVESYA